MVLRRLLVLMVLTLICGNGCKKPAPASLPPPDPPAAQVAAQPSPVAPGETLAAIHWLGKMRVEADTNAAVLTGVWNLAESRRLETQTLNRLSQAAWPLLHRAPDTNAAALLRPLLDDILQDEFYLVIRQVTNRHGDLVFAIRLDDRRAALWQTNLAAVMESLTAIRPTPAAKGRQGWSLRKHEVPNLLELTREQGWTVFGGGEDHNGLLDDVLARIERTQLPFPAAITNSWITCALDLRGVAAAFSLGWKLPLDFPRISFDVVGSGKDVWSYGGLYFPFPLSMELEPWNLPTNLMEQPLISFTAVRGFGTWLASLNAWQNLQAGPPPNQFFSWALQGLPMQTYFAAPLPDASNFVSRVTDRVVREGEPWFATHDLAYFARSKSYNGLEWKGLPYLYPFLKSVEETNGNFIFGGMFQSLPAEPLSTNFFQTLSMQTNLVYHHWEITGPRTEQWIYMGQFFRLVSKKAQMPPHLAGQAWLKSIASKLGQSVTQITRTGPGELSFNRKSTIGFTAIELNLLADWLESPKFPLGLHTLLATPETEAGTAPAAAKP